MGFTIADLGAEIMREMEEVARIASVCSNMKGALERRLRLASGRVRASSAEPQQRTVATSAVASTVADLCPLRIRDDGVGDDDMRMVESVRTETIDKDVKPNNGQEHADGSYLRERVRSLESKVSRLQETVERHDTSGAPLRAGAVYCWSEEIAHLREVCIRARYRTPDPGVGDGGMKPRWLICTTPTAKRGVLCSKLSKRRRDEPGMSFWPHSTPIPGDALTD
jgi:hypothetical protein